MRTIGRLILLYLGSAVALGILVGVAQFILGA
jgi:hypothetical protein